MEKVVHYESNMNSILDMLNNFKENKTKILVSVSDIYNTLPSEIIVIDKLFNNFAKCHSIRKGLPYTLTYNSLIMHDFDILIPDTVNIELYEDGKELYYKDGKLIKESSFDNI